MDFGYLAESLVYNKGLQTLDISQNKIFKARDLSPSKKFDKAGLIKQIGICMNFLKQIKHLESLIVNEWLFDDLEYPDQVADIIKETRMMMPEKASFGTAASILPK